MAYFQRTKASSHQHADAVVESSFSTLKAESTLFEFIEVFYSRQRRHSSLGYVSSADWV